LLPVKVIYQYTIGHRALLPLLSLFAGLVLHAFHVIKVEVALGVSDHVWLDRSGQVQVRWRTQRPLMARHLGKGALDDPMVAHREIMGLHVMNLGHDWRPLGLARHLRECRSWIHYELPSWHQVLSLMQTGTHHVTCYRLRIARTLDDWVENWLIIMHYYL
jgi:hypothetical protein